MFWTDERPTPPRSRSIVRCAAARGGAGAITMQVQGNLVYLLATSDAGRTHLVLNEQQVTRLLAEAGWLLLQAANPARWVTPADGDAS